MHSNDNLPIKVRPFLELVQIMNAMDASKPTNRKKLKEKLREAMTLHD